MTISETIRELDNFTFHYGEVEAVEVCQNCGIKIEAGLNRCGNCLYPTKEGL